MLHLEAPQVIFLEFVLQKSVLEQTQISEYLRELCFFWGGACGVSNVQIPYADFTMYLVVVGMQ